MIDVNAEKYRWRPKGPKEPKRCRICGSTHACKPTVGKITFVGKPVIDTVAVLCKEHRRTRAAQPIYAPAVNQ